MVELLFYFASRTTASLAAGGTIKRRLAAGVQVIPFARNKKREMLDPYRRSYFGALPSIWAKVPQDLIAIGKGGIRATLASLP